MPLITYVFVVKSRDYAALTTRPPNTQAHDFLEVEKLLITQSKMKTKHK